MRTPAGETTTIRDWRVVDQLLPVPFTLSPNDLRNRPDYIPVLDSLNGSFAAIRKFSDLRAYDQSEFTLSQLSSSSRLICRSVWNNQWLLIIPAGTLLSDREEALERFIHGVSGAGGVSDIGLVFSTYSYSGNIGVSLPRVPVHSPQSTVLSSGSASQSANLKASRNLAGEGVR